MILPVTKVQRFSTHDGPGIRTTVFLKGCPLRCRWCHNPETQSPLPQILYSAQLCLGCGACAAVCPVGAHTMDGDIHRFEGSRCTGCMRCPAVCPAGAIESAAVLMDTREILKIVERDAAFYGSDGGFTLSGGEPLFHGEASLQLLRHAKEAGLHTAVETCGYFSEELLPSLAASADLLLWDFKDSDDRRHRAYTGVSNIPILHNLQRADDLGCAIRLRCILVKGVNMDPLHYQAIAETAASLKNCQEVQLLPYHALGGSKNVQLGYADNSRKDWIPSTEELRQAEAFLQTQGITLLSTGG